MANKVFANNREVACKAADGKSICAFPDVCLSPPSPPAGPIPIPYPNTGMASDMTDGSKHVKISGKGVMLKDKSYFKKSTGDEAATKSLGMGVVTHQIQGKVYFTSWSMDVKFEGENVVRHFDLTTHNHASMPSNSPTWAYLDHMNIDVMKSCKQDMERVTNACPNAATAPDKDCTDPVCRQAKRCMLTPKDRSSNKGGCCPDQTGHHLLPEHCFSDVPGYKGGKAPCVCAEGWSWHRNDRSSFLKEAKTHPAFHEVQDVMERRVLSAFPVLKRLGKLAPNLSQDKPWKYASARNIGVATHNKVFSDPKCSNECLIAQLDAYHKQPDVGMQDDTPVLAKKYGNRDATSHRSSVHVWEMRLRALIGKS